MRLHRASEYRRSRWKNGKGETLEIAVHPPSATLDDFDWRISVALLEENGAFSEFPGIDRSITIIEGAGIDLVVREHVHRLTKEVPPFRFSGDCPAHATLLGGSSADLNVMTRRSTSSHEVQRLITGADVVGGAHFTAIFAQSDVSLSANGTGRVLSYGDLLELGVDEIATVSSGEAIQIRIDHPTDRGTLRAKPDETLR